MELLRPTEEGTRMAVVRDFRAGNGVRVIIRDDDYAGASPEELDRREKQYYGVIAQILRGAARRAEEAQTRGGTK